MTELLRHLLHTGATVFSNSSAAQLDDRLREARYDLEEVIAIVAGDTVAAGALVKVQFVPTRDSLIECQGLQLFHNFVSTWHWSKGWQSLSDVHVPIGRSSALRTADGLVLEVLDAVSIRRVDGGVAIHRVDSSLAAATRFAPGPMIAGFRDHMTRTKSISMRCYRSSFPKWQLWPIPAPCRAALAVTDHADFDTIDGLVELAGDSVINGKLQITKSVFVTNYLAPAPAALSSPEALRVVLRMADAGNEIAVHSTRPPGAGVSGVISDMAYLAGLPLEVRTWIDHGPVARTNTSRNGLAVGCNDDISGVLRDAGVRNVWAYLDRASNPLRLTVGDQLLSHKGLMRDRFVQAAQAGASGRLRDSCFFLADGFAGPEQAWLRHRLPSIKRAVTRRSVSPSGQPDPQHSFSKRQEWLDVVKRPRTAPLAATVYQRPILPDWTPSFFCSVRVNDLRRGLSEEALERFTADGGAEILHTYLLSNHPIAGWTGSWKTSNARVGLTRLAEVAGADIWSGPVAEWAGHLRRQYETALGNDAEGEWRTEEGKVLTTLVATGDGDRPPTCRRITLS